MTGRGDAAIAMGQCWWIWRGISQSIYFQIANRERWQGGYRLIPPSGSLAETAPAHMPMVRGRVRRMLSRLPIGSSFL